MRGPLYLIRELLLGGRGRQVAAEETEMRATSHSSSVTVLSPLDLLRMWKPSIFLRLLCFTSRSFCATAKHTASCHPSEGRSRQQGLTRALSAMLLLTVMANPRWLLRRHRGGGWGGGWNLPSKPALPRPEKTGVPEQAAPTDQPGLQSDTTLVASAPAPRDQNPSQGFSCSGKLGRQELQFIRRRERGD